MKKIINLAHHVDDYECMWNGIEDMYMAKSHENIPSFLFFSISAIGKFCYLKTNKSKIKRMVSFGDGRTKKMYNALSHIVGFTYKCIEGRTFSYTLKKAKQQIDMEKPVVLGPLDMYYLEYYPKMYLKEHIPYHYVLMIGYDEEGVFIYDCGKDKPQKLSYESLEKSLNIVKTDLGDKNSIFIIDFDDKVNNVLEIAKKSLQIKAEEFLYPPTNFLGVKGMYKLAGEIDNWKDELNRDDLNGLILNFLNFTGTVPCLPARMTKGEESNIKHMAQREKLACVLKELGEKYKIEQWIKSSNEFLKSGAKIEEIVEDMISYMLKEKNELNNYSEIIKDIAEMEKQGFVYMLEGCR